MTDKYTVPSNWDTEAEAQTITLTIAMDYCILNF